MDFRTFENFQLFCNPKERKIKHLQGIQQKHALFIPNPRPFA